MSMGLYIYGFIKEKEKKEFGVSELLDLKATIHTINVGEVAAVVSEALKIEYDPTRKNTLAHQKVLLKLMDHYGVVPVAFGMVASNKKDVETIIKANYNEFINNLKKVEGKIELGLRVTWNNNYFDQDIQDEDIIKLNQRVYSKDENQILSEKILLGQLVESSINLKREQYREEIFKPLMEIATEGKYKDNLPIKTVLNAYFLVDKSLVETFDEKVEEIASKYENKLVFSYTGPWPAYNFIDVDINYEFLT